MRLEVHVEIGGAALVDGETGSLELARILLTASEKAMDGELALVQDEIALRDYNGNTVGYARLVPDWTVGEEVWVTNEVGSMLKSTVHSVSPHPADGYWAVACRFIASHELLPAVVVDAWGRDHHGRPLLGRVR